jgi:hypothetical protein
MAVAPGIPPGLAAPTQNFPPRAGTSSGCTVIFGPGYLAPISQVYIRNIDNILTSNWELELVPHVCVKFTGSGRAADNIHDCTKTI